MMRGVMVGFLVAVCIVIGSMLSAQAYATTRVERQEVSIDSVQCGDYGLLQRGQWNECFVRVLTRTDLKSVTLTTRVIETGYAQTTPPFDILRMSNARQSPSKNGLDVSSTRLVPFYIPVNHPTGSFMLELELRASATRRFRTSQSLPLDLLVFRQITVR